ncbi:phosphopantetheine-binding protein [Bradyrhizobium sp.]|uniref:phosphopantetheine-binding protein n=1 Tax=Bradyrhizobium sp. TaxID=376 RepID=UPI003C380D01
MTDDLEALVIDVVSPFIESPTALTGATALGELLDSMAMVQVILALEGRLGCSFGPSDIQFDHFETIDMLALQLASIKSQR